MQGERLVWPDLLRVIAIFAVILLHSAAPFLVQFGEVPARVWWTGNLYDTLVRWCVPVFIMLSGALLLGRVDRDSLGAFFAKRLRRVLVPLVAWSFFYYWWSVFEAGGDLSLIEFLLILITEPAYYHLWFLYIIIGLYFLAPVLSGFVLRAGGRNIAYLLILWFVLVAVIPVIEHFSGITTAFSVGWGKDALKFSGYFVLGYVLRDVRLNRSQTAGAAAVFAASAAVTAIGTWAVTRSEGFSEVFYEYYTFSVFFMSVSVFLICRTLIRETYPSMKGGWAFLRELSSCVFGIYLLHALVLELLRQDYFGFQFSQRSFAPVLGIPLYALAAFWLSFPVIFLLHKVPLVRNVVP